MKKTKGILIGLTLALSGYIAFAYYNIAGDQLLYLDSQLGYGLATTYKWATIMLIILLISDIFVFQLSRKYGKKAESTPKFIKTTVSEITIARCIACGTEKENTDKFCKKCGKSFAL